MEIKEGPIIDEEYNALNIYVSSYQVSKDSNRHCKGSADDCQRSKRTRHLKKNVQI